MSKISLRRLVLPALAAVLIGPLAWGILIVLFQCTMVGIDAGAALFVDPKIAKGLAVTAPIYLGASYYFGAPIALIAGLLVGVIWILGHRPTFLIVLAAAIFATVLWEIGKWGLGFESRFYPAASATFAAGAIVAATTCWFLLRGYVSRI
jgi:hypothetical protein